MVKPLNAEPHFKNVTTKSYRDQAVYQLPDSER